MKKYDLVVTRHPALVEYLQEKGIVDSTIEVLSHVSDSEKIRNKNIVGVLPLALASQCKSVTEVVMDLPAELRGKELTLAQVKSCARKIKAYKVKAIA